METSKKENLKNLDAKTKKALEIEKNKQAKAKQLKDNLDKKVDNVNLLKQLKNIDIPKESLNNVAGMFKYSELIKDYANLSKEEQKKQTKQLRKKIRKQRNVLLFGICEAFKQKNNTVLKDLIKQFNIFYKETYLLNDYSLNSIARNSSDKENLILFNISLNIIKNFKIK